MSEFGDAVVDIPFVIRSMTHIVSKCQMLKCQINIVAPWKLWT